MLISIPCAKYVPHSRAPHGAVVVNNLAALGVRVPAREALEVSAFGLGITGVVVCELIVAAVVLPSNAEVAKCPARIAQAGLGDYIDVHLHVQFPPKVIVLEHLVIADCWVSRPCC